ncbi:Xylose isomerase domain protein TIM barrel [Lachnoclostridium phytofermentans ISDg]|uniref:Xylose isomerase domain protein TIM barrel n=2 Tax=Lachnoclostridium phytofermentans TaxID=66219 RepID=A9KLZ4_LACP7|nr:Xylose isomerase domain protein TIM barrel [Lachnoclostridium phytofermentans ISDg]
MLRMINLVNYDSELERFTDKEDLIQFYSKYEIDGIELQKVQELQEKYLHPDMIIGMHLSFYNTWVDFYKGDMDKVLNEYGTMEVVEQIYGGTDKSAILKAYKEQLEFADRIGAKYVVFHICDVSVEETFTGRFIHSDEEVIDASCSLINELLDGKSYQFDFLMENLWWPGLNYKNPLMAKRLIDGVNYTKKGLMLDTGHLMNTNQELKTPKDALQYIRKVMKEHSSIKEYIKGIHLHQSLSGENAKRMRSSKIELKQDYWERMYQLYEYIFSLDEHKPFVCEGVKEFIEEINPKYLTYELITRNREEHETYLKQISTIYD